MTTMLDTILIANRGEIAVRVARTLRRMGIRTVAVYSDADADARHVREADTAVRLGPASARESYLDIDKVIAAAKATGAQGIHPGYGFLSENSHFAAACAEAGIAFLGPPEKAIEVMGDKIAAKAAVSAFGVPVVPGISRPGLSDDDLVAGAPDVGFPVLVKPSAGGGGKGMRLVERAEDLPAALASARREAASSFGDDTLFLERFVLRPRHIEVQILADGHGNVIHLGERDCSIQRRHQKLLEESPSPALTPELRLRMGEAAVAAARSINYEGAGTVEFLLDRKGDFYFMEMNTRIQVEHPVTEMVTGIDLIAEQLHIAGGDPISIKQEDIQLRGHAIECRINAEDSTHNFRPSPGQITGWLPPGGPGVRIDSHVYTGYDIPPFYDSLIGKVIAWGHNRDAALKRMKRALNECAVTGIPTTVEFHLELLNREEFLRGDVHTKFVEQDMLD